MTDDVFELRAEALAEELGIGRHPPYCIDSVEEATPIILAALREAREEGTARAEAAEAEVKRLRVEIGETALVLESQDLKLHAAMAEVKRLREALEFSVERMKAYGDGESDTLIQLCRAAHTNSGGAAVHSNGEGER
jgi:hypothetical protein